jgi:hypothetical protein
MGLLRCPNDLNAFFLKDRPERPPGVDPAEVVNLVGQ